MSSELPQFQEGDARPRKPTTNIKIETRLDARHSTHVPFDFVDRERRQRLELLYDLPLQFNAASDLKALFQLIIEKVVGLTSGAERGALLVYESGTGKLAVRGSVPAEEPVVSRTLVQRAVQEGSGIIWRREDEPSPISASIDRLRIETGMYAPLLWQGELMGVICVDNPERHAIFTDEDLRFLMSVANYAASALANYQLQDNIRHNALVLERLLTNFSPKLRSKLLEKARDGGLRPGGEKSEVTILFSDIRGFAKLTSSWDAEAVMDLLNDYFALLVEAIFQHDGTIDKFVGDGILTVFGSPEPDPEHHLKAVRAALAMQEAMRAQNQIRAARNQITCEIGIGIHCGEVLHGFVGSVERLEFTVIGDVVNKAARYCEGAKPGEILISPAVYERIGHALDTAPTTIHAKHEGSVPACVVKGLKG